MAIQAVNWVVSTKMKRMSVSQRLVLAGAVWLLMLGCERQDADFPTKPDIEFEDIAYLESLPEEVTSSNDTTVSGQTPHIRIRISFKDAEGDLGLEQQEQNDTSAAAAVFVRYYALIDDEFVPFIDKASEGNALDPTDGAQKVFEGRTLDNLTPETNTKAIKGTLSIFLVWGPDEVPKGADSDNPLINVDYQNRVQFDVYLRDRASNYSDTVQTTPVEIPDS